MDFPLLAHSINPGFRRRIPVWRVLGTMVRGLIRLRHEILHLKAKGLKVGGQVIRGMLMSFLHGIPQVKKAPRSLCGVPKLE